MVASDSIALIAGLGNPGDKYSKTRHNVGFWFVNALANNQGAVFQRRDRFRGELADIRLGHKCTLLKPHTFMNLSGQSVGALVRFLNIDSKRLLVVHDELDLAPGVVKLKLGGGHGGHNGLRDIIGHIGGDFWRLRVGIGHPGSAKQVVNYVLNRPTAEEQPAIERALDNAAEHVHSIVDGEFDKAMNSLHRQ